MPASPAQGAVLLHGFGALPATMWPIKKQLSNAGFETLSPFYPSWRMPLNRIITKLHTPINAFAQRLNGPLHFIGHSMGGLIIRAYIKRYRPANLGHVVMLGTPNSGSELADFLNSYQLLRPILGRAAPALITQRDTRSVRQLGIVDYPIGIIAGNRALINGPLAAILPRPHDGKVSVAATHVEEESDHMVAPVTHTMLPYNQAVRSQALHFLQYGAFSRKSDLAVRGMMR